MNLSRLGGGTLCLRVCLVRFFSWDLKTFISLHAYKTVRLSPLPNRLLEEKQPVLVAQAPLACSEKGRFRDTLKQILAEHHSQEYGDESRRTGEQVQKDQSVFVCRQ